VGFGGVLVFALLVTGIGSRALILQPVSALLQTMRRLGAGELAARTGLPHTRSEVGQLAAALDEMANHLEAREAGADRSPGLLRECEERFRRLANETTALVWLSGPHGQRTFFNRAWLDFTGRSPAESEGRGWLESVHPEDREPVLNAWGAALAARREFRVEYRLRHADGRYCRIRETGTPRLPPDGSMIGYMGVGQEIIEGKQVTEAAG
ncbi:MAG TPA: PAS domain-containing protein, partial [Candidatus Methylomirabilis sp.]